MSAVDALIQAILDLLIPGQSPGIKERLVDLYGKPELLFFGPDGRSTLSMTDKLILSCISEGTADMMDWAASRRSFVHNT